VQVTSIKMLIDLLKRDQVLGTRIITIATLIKVSVIKIILVLN